MSGQEADIRTKTFVIIAICIATVLISLMWYGDPVKEPATKIYQEGYVPFLKPWVVISKERSLSGTEGEYKYTYIDANKQVHPFWDNIDAYCVGDTIP